MERSLYLDSFSCWVVNENLWCCSICEIVLIFLWDPFGPLIVFLLIKFFLVVSSADRLNSGKVKLNVQKTPRKNKRVRTSRRWHNIRWVLQVHTHTLHPPVPGSNSWCFYWLWSIWCLCKYTVMHHADSHIMPLHRLNLTPTVCS